LELSEGLSGGSFNTDINDIKDPFNAKFKSKFKGAWISNYGYSLEDANQHLRNGQTDLISFGWPYVANPDLVEKFANGTQLSHVKYIKDMSQFVGLVYYGGPLGYTDLSVYAPNQP
jgi:N-ethylmaleimide reductase